jgi:sarcosine oxidase delta subunit
MKSHWFEYDYLHDSLRGLNRKQYKALRQWLRVCRNRVEKQINMDELHEAMVNAAVLGTTFPLRFIEPNNAQKSIRN